VACACAYTSPLFSAATTNYTWKPRCRTTPSLEYCPTTGNGHLRRCLYFVSQRRLIYDVWPASRNAVWSLLLAAASIDCSICACVVDCPRCEWPWRTVRWAVWKWRIYGRWYTSRAFPAAAGTSFNYLPPDRTEAAARPATYE